MRQKRKWQYLLPVMLGIMAAACFGLSVREYAPYVKNEIEQRRLKEEAVKEEEGGRKIDWDKLKKINPDIIAWIEVPGTKVDYPVLRCPSFSYYLHRNEKRQENVLGSIFVQPETAEDFTDRHTVIYGHNMSDQQMFGSLHKFEEKKFWKGHRDVFIYQPRKKIRAVIYSVYDVQDKTDTYEVSFETEEAWQKWIEMSVDRKYYETSIEPGQDDFVITLSTCSNGRGRSSRFVVNCMVMEVEDSA